MLAQLIAWRIVNHEVQGSKTYCGSLDNTQYSLLREFTHGCSVKLNKAVSHQELGLKLEGRAVCIAVVCLGDPYVACNLR